MNTKKKKENPGPTIMVYQTQEEAKEVGKIIFDFNEVIRGNPMKQSKLTTKKIIIASESILKRAFQNLPRRLVPILETARNEKEIEVILRSEIKKFIKTMPYMLIEKK